MRQTSGTIFTAFKTLIGKPSRRTPTKAWPAPPATAPRPAGSTNASAVPRCPPTRGPEGRLGRGHHVERAGVEVNRAGAEAAVVQQVGLQADTLRSGGIGVRLPPRWARRTGAARRPTRP